MPLLGSIAPGWNFVPNDEWNLVTSFDKFSTGNSFCRLTNSDLRLGANYQREDPTGSTFSWIPTQNTPKEGSKVHNHTLFVEFLSTSSCFQRSHIKLIVELPVMPRFQTVVDQNFKQYLFLSLAFMHDGIPTLDIHKHTIRNHITKAN